MSRRYLRALAPATLLLVVLAAGCRSVQPRELPLPTGQRLDPAAPALELGSMPLAMRWSPDSAQVVVLLCGYREQGLQIVDARTQRVTQTIVQPAAFVGLAFAPDGRTLYASGGNQDVVYRYDWQAGHATLRDSLVLATREPKADGTRYPAGLALSPDGTRLYVAENLADSLAVIDVNSGRVLQHLATGRYPYDVVVAPSGRVFVSAWGGDAIASFMPSPAGLVASARIVVGRHPSALALQRDGATMYATRASYDRIAVIDTRTERITRELSVTPAGAPEEGATPNALALSEDGSRLYVAEADHNAIAVFDLHRDGADALLGRIPTEWYPTGALVRRDQLVVLTGKGQGSHPNPGLRQPGLKGKRDAHQYTLGQTSGSLMTVRLPDASTLATYSARVATADGWNATHWTGALPPFEHVVYIIKENRTYDQVFGDLAAGDGDTSLVFFPRPMSPNHHALAERFGLFDRFMVNAEVSGQGHDWSTSAYTPDYVEKTIPSNYSGRGRTYDYEGINRDTIPEDDVNESVHGYVWDMALRAGVTIQNFGEFTHQDDHGRWVANKPSLAPYTHPSGPGWDLEVPDVKRAAVWIDELHRHEAEGTLPQLTILRLPNDHTAGARAHAPTPRAYMADNDLALGRVIEALSHSRFWASTVVFVLEDDAQDGPDHVDSHRSPLLVISAYNRPGVVHRFANTTDVLATIGAILHLSPMSQYDHFGRTIHEVFGPTPDTRPYTALVPSVPLDQTNPADTTHAGLMRQLRFDQEDMGDQEPLNRLLWAMLKGPDRPYPGKARRSVVAPG